MIGFIISLVISILVKVVLFKVLNDSLDPALFALSGEIEIYALAAVIFGFLNTFVRPFIKLVTLPIHFLTLGLSSFLLNGFMLWLWELSVNHLVAADTVQISGWMTYVGIGFLIAVVSGVIHFLTRG